MPTPTKFDGPLPQPATFPEHTNGIFYCWCIPDHELRVDESGELFVAVTHFSRSDN